MSHKPLAIDLYCGLGGWTEALLSEGWDVIGFDIERHQYGTEKYPAMLVLQDVQTLHGSQFKDVDLIVASPPCQAYSYRAMPWKRAKALPPPDNTLFETCFRIQKEASEAAGRHIPLIVENVRGAQPWVGRARWNFGSFYLWGDVPALMPTAKPIKGKGGAWFKTADTADGKYAPGNFRNDVDGRKNNGGSWFNIGSPGQKETNLNPVHELAGEGIKQRGSGREWFAGDGKISRMTSSKSNARKAASAMIAKIPFPLAQHIARTFKPR